MKPSHRCFILVLDSFGVGASHDAIHYGDQGGDTLGHIAEYCLTHRESKPLHCPHLFAMGLDRVYLSSTGKQLAGVNALMKKQQRQGTYAGYAVERSLGKDTPSGHWEMAGCPVFYNWRTFPVTSPCFPEALTEALLKQAGLPGFLGNQHASGTEIIQALGETQLSTGKPILYTSADSVLQIAAHQTHFGLERLYQTCEIARSLSDPYNIGRVIARPFIGEKKGQFQRTEYRRDYGRPPHADTVLDHLVKAGRTVFGIGKISDIFSQRGISVSLKGKDTMALFDATLDACARAQSGDLVFSNFVDFDSLYGHRRDPAGYANALEAFDARLPELQAQMKSEDMLIITADHGCDPTFFGSDHTREHLPILAYSPAFETRWIGRRESLADIGQSVAAYLSVQPTAYGVSFV